MLLGSVSGGDRNVYRLTFGGAEQDQLSNFSEPSGFSAELHGNLAKLRQQVLKAPADKDTPKRPFYVVMGGGTTTSASVPNRLQGYETHRKAYPYPNVVFYNGQTLIEQGVYKDPAGLSPAMNWGAGIVPTEEMLKTAEACEKHGYTHVLNIAHGTDAFWSLPTLEEYLKRTPTSCIAMEISELNSNLYSLEEFARSKSVHDRFVRDFLVPCMDLAVKYKKPLWLLMHQHWFVSVPALDEPIKEIFTPERRPWVVPLVEESGTTAPETNVMGMVGLWRSGLVKQWASNDIADQLDTARVLNLTATDPQVLLRHMAADIGLGASIVRLNHSHLRNYRSAYPQFKVGGINYTPHGQLSLDTIIHLVGKGLLDMPTPETLVGVSDVAFSFAEPSELFVRRAPATTRATRTQRRPRTGCSRTRAGRCVPARPPYAPNYLFNISRFSHHFILDMPYGMIVALPQRLLPEKPAWLTKTWTTDGVDVLVDGREAVGHGRAGGGPGVVPGGGAAAAGAGLQRLLRGHAAGGRDAAHVGDGGGGLLGAGGSGDHADDGRADHGLARRADGQQGSVRGHDGEGQDPGRHVPAAGCEAGGDGDTAVRAPNRVHLKEGVRLMMRACGTCPSCMPTTSWPSGRLPASSLPRVYAWWTTRSPGRRL